jgi:hypothetical protein
LVSAANSDPVLTRKDSVAIEISIDNDGVGELLRTARLRSSYSRFDDEKVFVLGSPTPSLTSAVKFPSG